MANLAVIIGCKNNKLTKYCKDCNIGKKWDGKGCIKFMKDNNMKEITEYISVSLG